MKKVLVLLASALLFVALCQKAQEQKLAVKEEMAKADETASSSLLILRSLAGNTGFWYYNGVLSGSPD